MRATKIILAVMAMSGSLSMMAQGAADLAKSLKQTTDYLRDATFEVLLPSALDPVTYDITLESESTFEADTLSPARYLIRWTTVSGSGPLEGFSAYYEGNHYRYRNNRLQEYHATANIDPFQPLGPGSQYRNGVQATAQFADLLPQYLGLKIDEIINDSSYIYQWHPDTIVSGRKSMVIDGVKRGTGYDVMAYSYVFDKVTGLPVSIELENSPGSISEQLVSVSYSEKSDADKVDISENGLIETWPDVFEKFRESTFRAENLVNTPLPAFACQRLDGNGRYAHHSDETFAQPLIIVILDPGVATTAETIASIRQAVDSAPMGIDVIWAFTSNHAEEIAPFMADVRSGETALMSAGQLVRNCGITLFPTTILVDRTSKVTDVISGYNNELDLVVLQKAMLLK